MLSEEDNLVRYPRRSINCRECLQLMKISFARPTQAVHNGKKKSDTAGSHRLDPRAVDGCKPIVPEQARLQTGDLSHPNDGQSLNSNCEWFLLLIALNLFSVP